MAFGVEYKRLVLFLESFSMYYIYMIRCVDNSIYTGITTDVERRMEEHFSGDKKRCAKYTLVHLPKKLECVWETSDKKKASKLEYHIKSLTKSQKEKVIKTRRLDEFLENKIDINEYIFCEEKFKHGEI